MRFDCHFAQRNAGRPAQSAPLMQVPAHVRWALRNLQNWMVRAVGIEPTLLSELDFESSASTSSTTPATRLSIAQPSFGATPKESTARHVAGFVTFLRAAIGFGLALRTLTADASMLFFRCRP